MLKGDPGVMDEHLLALGRLTITFAAFESEIDSFINAYLPDTGKLLTKELKSLPTRIEVLESLAAKRMSKATFLELQPVLEKSKKFPSVRNDYIHSMWGYIDFKNNRLHPMMIRTRGKLEGVPIPVSVAKVKQTNDEIMDTLGRLRVLILESLQPS